MKKTGLFLFSGKRLLVPTLRVGMQPGRFASQPIPYAGENVHCPEPANALTLVGYAALHPPYMAAGDYENVVDGVANSVRLGGRSVSPEPGHLAAPRRGIISF
ncbi:MAG: hypothetical protein B6245_07665 [Desulfobacteraceae bacterium 4572_88]|nr:MAG: hypothetical protein B6245_07665 [Desulfobacteraceae bacterium 4572_88]